METLSYNKEILTATGEMIRIFSNISIIQLHDKDGNAVKSKNAKKILVPLKYAQSSRILKSILNPKGAPQEYPIITLEKDDLTYALERNTEIHHDMANRTVGYDPNTHPPIPVNIGFTINIFAKYPEDVDMIVSNFASWFNTDVYVTSPHPKLNGKYLNHQIIWEGNVNYDWKSTISSTDQDIIIAKTKFTYRTEIFAGYEKLNDDPTGIIHNIVFDFSTPGNHETLYPEYDESKAAEYGNAGGGFYSVPYDEDFNNYAEKIISNTIAPSALDYDKLVYNTFNEQFNEAIINCDFDALTSVAASGADMYKHSYWPYAYASALGYTQITEWLDSKGSLKPSSTPHYPPPVSANVQIADRV